MDRQDFCQPQLPIEHERSVPEIQSRTMKPRVLTTSDHHDLQYIRAYRERCVCHIGWGLHTPTIDQFMNRIEAKSIRTGEHERSRCVRCQFEQDILINFRQCRDDLRCEFWATGEFIGREGAFYGLSECDHSLSSPGMIPMYGPSSSSSEYLGRCFLKGL